MNPLQLQKMSPSEFYEAEKQINERISDLDDSQKVWHILNKQFEDLSYEEDYYYRWTYFRMYTFSLWRSISSFKMDDLLDIAIRRQIVMAALLEFNVMEEWIDCLRRRSMNSAEMGVNFKKAKSILSSSGCIVGMSNGKEYTVKEMYEDIDKLNNMGNKSLDVANYKTRLAKILVPDNDEYIDFFYYANTDKVVGNLFNLVHFFLGLNQKTVWGAVELHTDPLRYEVLAKKIDKQEEESNVISLDQLEDVNNKTKGNLQETEEKSKEPQDHEHTTEELLRKELFEHKEKTMNPYRKIRIDIANKYGYDSEGDLNNPESVFSELEKLSTERNDEKISSMYFFDEQTMKFKWNDELFN